LVVKALILMKNYFLINFGEIYKQYADISNVINGFYQKLFVYGFKIKVGGGTSF